MVAATFAAEIGDVRWFDTPRRTDVSLSLVAAERLTGPTAWCQCLTLAGNRPPHRVLAEAVWTYRYSARLGETVRARLSDWSHIS